MDLDDENDILFGELFGSHTKKAARIISPNRPQQRVTKIQEESSNQSDSDDDDFALPSTTPSTPATDGGPSSAGGKKSVVDGEGGSSGMDKDRILEAWSISMFFFSSPHMQLFEFSCT